MIDIRLLRHILALGKHRHFARAAESLHISQPALTRSIAGIEHTLGVKLFDRAPRRIEPTTFGQMIIERGQRVIDQEKDLRREILLMQGIEIGELSIGAGPFPFEISVCKAVAKLVAQHPKLQIRLGKNSPPEILRLLLCGAIDLGVADIRHCQNDSRLEIELLPLHTVVCCCRREHPLAGKVSLTLNEILGYPLVGTVFPQSLAAMLPADIAAGRVDTETRNFLPAITVDSLTAARTVALGCDALLPITPGCVDIELQSGDLVILNFHAPWMSNQYGFISKKDRTHSPSALEFMAKMREVERQEVEREKNLIATFSNFTQT